MRHRIKKIPTLSKLSRIHNHHLLHSDKSTYTYFYKGKVRDFFKSRLTPTQPCTNGVWCASPHCDKVNTPTVSTLANRTQRSQDITPYSAVAGRANRLGNSRFSTIPLVLSSIALLLVLGLMISPSIAMGEGILASIEQASAIEQDLGNGSKISLAILNNNTELADDATVSANANPGIVSYISNIIRINTSRIGKYYVGIQAASDGTSDLIGLNHHDTITGVGENVTPNNFGDNTWGYALTSNTTMSDSDLSYNTLPAYNTNSVIQHTSETNPVDGNHDLKLTFAAKINANKPGDHYQTKAMVSVAADFLNLTTQFLGFNNINNMQDMTPEICSAARIGETKRLKDTRDNKYYWVTKLADGNCWMTQNLDLDLDGITLKSTDSDVTSDWVSTTGPSTMIGYNNDTGYHKAQYYDAGEYVYTKPTTAKDCNAGADGLAGGTCATDGWVNVKDMTASPDPNFGTEVVNNTYNAHYSVGNYYSWTAATVESGKDLTVNNTDAPSSICPKGWQLPYSGRDKFNNNYQSPEAKDPTNNKPINRNKSFINLLEAYGWGPGINNLMWGGRDDWGNPYAPLDVSSYNIAGTPLHLLRGGIVYSGSLGNVGINGYYWSSTAQSATGAYLLDFYSSNVTPSSNTYRSSGFSIRCVAR